MQCLVLYSFISCFSLFLVFGFLGRVQIQILWSRPTSMHRFFNEGFGLFPLCMSMLCLLVHALCFRSMLVCLDLGSLPCSCLFSICGFVACWSLGPLACLVASVPFGGLLGYNHVRGHIFMMFGLLASCLFPPLFSLACQGFSCQPFYVPYNMFTLPLCVITCFASFVLALLALCHLLWLSLLCFHPFIFAYMFMHVSLCACLCHQAQFLHTISCEFIPIDTQFCTHNLTLGDDQNNHSQYLLRTVFSTHKELLHWQPMPHQHIIDFLGKSI